MLLTSLLGSLSRSYISSAAQGWKNVASRGGAVLGDYNALREMDTTNSKAVVALTDLKALEKQLKEFGPDALRKFKNNSRQVGTPARDALRSVFKSVGIRGPLGGPTRRGRRYDKMATNYNIARLSYERGFVTANTSRGIDVNYKNRNEGKALRQLQTAQDGTISIVRLLVKAPALIVADMAGKSSRAKIPTGSLVRGYQTNLFNRGVVQASENMRRMTPERRAARDAWLLALDRTAHNRRQNKASRYAWPTMEKYMSKHKINVAQLLNEVIATTNKKLAD